jgi:hypothetical protein
MPKTLMPFKKVKKPIGRAKSKGILKKGPSNVLV